MLRRRRLLAGAPIALGAALGTASLGLTLAGAPMSVRAHALRDWPPSKIVPPLRLPRLDGGEWDLAAQRGHPVLVNFWASWCEPCRDEMPSLALLAQRHEADGLVLMTVNHQEGEAPIRRFLDRIGLADLPVLLDRDGRAAQAWTPRVFPTTLLIDAQGRPRRQVIGEVDWGGAEPRAWVRELLAR
jgi:thiol-disulfide isomerase/thioredoxin